MNKPPNMIAGLYLAFLLGWKDLLMRFHSPIMLIFVVVLPVAMTFLTGEAFKSFQSRVDVTIALEDNDHGPVADRFKEEVKHAADWLDSTDTGVKPEGNESVARVQFLPEALDHEEGLRRLRNRELSGLVVLPEDLSRQIQAGKESQVQLLVRPPQTLERSVTQATVDRLVLRVQEKDPRLLQWEPVAEGSDPTLVEGFNAFNQSVAGNGVMFILLNCVILGAMSIVRERSQNTLDRLMISPMNRGMIFLGKVLGVFMVGVLQAVVVFGFGVLIGVRLGSPFGVALVTLLFILVGCSLGLTISALFRREETVQTLGAPISLLLTLLGGGMVPFDMAPPWLQKVALLLPTGWAMGAYHKLMWDGQPWTAVWLNLVILAGFALVFLVVGSRSLRWE